MQNAGNALRIGLNGTCFNDRPSGARNRFNGIYGELIQRMPDAEFVVFEPADCPVGAWFGDRDNVIRRQTPVPSEGRTGRFLAGLGFWWRAFGGQTYDVFENFHMPAVSAPAAVSLLTIHDVRGVQPDQPRLERYFFRRVLMRSIASADIIVTVSRTMKDEILSICPDAEVAVLYNGLDPTPFRTLEESELDGFRRKYRLPQEFLLSVGHFEPRKNYDRLVDAVALLRDRGHCLPLVLIGNDNGERSALAAQVAKLGLTGSVIMLSGLSDHEVRCAYRLCSLFVFPSLYEGFGIPVLESMAARRPMVVSNLPVFRELTEDRYLSFAPEDTAQMASMIDLGLSSDTACDEMIAYGDTRIGDFSFSGLAAVLQQIYEQRR